MINVQKIMKDIIIMIITIITTKTTFERLNALVGA